MTDYISREAALAECDWYANEFCECEYAIMPLKGALENLPAADVPPALWTDEPISGTEFMTHNQGQSGFEIHFRTDDKAKYEAVQDECRRQIDHAKPSADVRPVVRAKWELDSDKLPICSNCGEIALQRIFVKVPHLIQDVRMVKSNFCPNCGAMMEES